MSDSKPRSDLLKPLARLVPYLMRYKPQLTAALVFLVMAAGATLTVPIAVRRMLDGVFVQSHSVLIEKYFLAMIGVVAILAISSAGRYYFSK